MAQHAIEVDHGGMIIRGTAYTPDRDGRHPTVLMLHGFTGQRIEADFLFVHLARRLTICGMASVAFDFRHSGESDGSFERMLVTGEVADAVHMAHWLGGQPFADRSRLAVLGFSLGGLVAACTVARARLFQAMVMLAPTTVDNICRIVQRDDRPADEPITAGSHLLHADFEADIRTLDPLSDVTRHPRPTLVVQGTGDNAVPPAVSRQYVDAMMQAELPVAWHEIDGANHTFSSPAWRRDLFTVVTDFLAGHLNR